MDIEEDDEEEEDEVKTVAFRLIPANSAQSNFQNHKTNFKFN